MKRRACWSSGPIGPPTWPSAEHPLKATKHELELHGQCEEIPLEFLSVNAVAEYLSRRFARHEWPSELARALHRRTDGNPLFLVNTIDDLVVRGQLHEVDGQWVLAEPVQDLVLGAPETLSQMIQKQVERLTADEQAMLAVGCVAGSEFSAAVGTADGIGAVEAERRCDALARRGQFLRAIGVAEWPDGTVAGRYAFIHSLYQHVLYVRLPFGQRARLHLRTGERLEQGYGQRAGEIAGELAAHFAEGRDIARAAQYHQQAAEVALRQHGYREAADHLTRALDFLKALPDSPQRTQRELMLHELTVNAMLGAAFTVLTGRAGPEVERAYARARELCEQVDDPPRVFPVLLALGWFYFIRGSQGAARDVGARMLAIAEATGDRAFFLIGHHTMGVASFYGGEFETALGHLERGVELYDPQAHSPMRSPAFRHHLDTGVSCRMHGGWALWVLGYPARAVEWMRAAMELARSIDHPFSAGALPSLHGAVPPVAGRARPEPGAGRAGRGPGDRAWLQRRPLVGELPPGPGHGRRRASRGRPRAHARVGGRVPARSGRNACSPPTGRGWPRRMAGSGEAGTVGISCRRHWPRRPNRAITTGRPTCTGCGARSRNRRRTPRRLSSRRSRSRGDSARSRSSCARRRT